ncbi:multiple sugar transport system substrate-binding protein [Thermosporothrix hazakensis]|uniref:Multiple sugar transport system substrate-binding protein n=1 Tax=Thermosporothrix hazakensis TaxID=644383 RepID=A0A326U8G7_THEHA|nr:extracellular solute-binding protein [Thermosporothrix hazakensis]PZW32026.1 multiple sugar transport system substrate-binding protein [Thermosporothrix hazakensis]GCE49646.1 sugar-binding protein [Thermosporothrix hazakensis]
MVSSMTRRHFFVNGSKIIVGSTMLGAALAACGGSGGSAQDNKLRYWVLGYSPKGGNDTGKLTDAAVAAFKKSHAGLTVDVTGYTGDQAGFTKLVQAVQSGSTVDVFRLPSDVLQQLVAQKSVAPIDDFLTEDDKKDIYPQLLDSVRGDDGKHYSWPLWVPPVGMFLNLDIFKERGVEVPPDDWTYEQFVDIAKRLTFTRSNGQKVYGYSGVIDAGVVNTWPIIMGDGAYPLSKDNKKYTFNTPEGYSGLQKLVDLALKYKVTPPDFGTQAPADLITGFSEKRNYAMYSEPSGSSKTYRNKNMNFVVKPMPIGASGKHITAGGIGLISVANLRDENKLKLAMEMARYLTGSQVAKDVDGYYLAPGARKSVVVQDPINMFTPFVEYTYITPMIKQWPQIRKILHDSIQKAVLGKISVKEALDGPASEINSILSGS